MLKASLHLSYTLVIRGCSRPSASWRPSELKPSWTWKVWHGIRRRPWLTPSPLWTSYRNRYNSCTCHYCYMIWYLSCSTYRAAVDSYLLCFHEKSFYLTYKPRIPYNIQYPCVLVTGGDGTAPSTESGPAPRHCMGPIHLRLRRL